MATGMVSSAQSLDRLPATAVLRSGERISTSAAALKDPNAKTYHHMVPGARFAMPDGLEIIFMGGHFSTADPGIIAELDKVANRGTSLIYTQQAAAAQVTAQIAAAAKDAAEQVKE
jgi:hypothetical protein